MIPLIIIVMKGLSIFSILGSDEANMGLRPSILENGVLHLYIVVYHGMKHFSMLVHFSLKIMNSSTLLVKPFFNCRHLCLKSKKNFYGSVQQVFIGMSGDDRNFI